MDKLEIYQKLSQATKENARPKMSLTKTPGGNLIAQRSFGGINFQTAEDAERGLAILMKAGWPVKVMVPGMKKPQERKTVKSVMDNFFGK